MSEGFWFLLIICLIIMIATAFGCTMCTMQNRSAVNTCIQSKEWCKISEPMYYKIIYENENVDRN